MTPTPEPINKPHHTTNKSLHLTGAELQSMREGAGLSREALAQLVGVQARTIKHWENGRAGVPDDVAHVAAKAAQRVATAAHRLRMQARRTHHGTPGFSETAWGPDGEPHHLQIGQATPPAPVVLMRYRETEHMHHTEAAAGFTADTHGAAVAQALQGLSLDNVPTRVVWFDHAAYASWIDAQRLADTPAMRQHWADFQALRAQTVCFSE
jgi:DNA-binding XRE family transcriptional regulator